MFKNFLFIILAFPTFMFGMVFESSSFDNILNYVEEGTILFCDLDNTLVEAQSQLGTADSGIHLVKKLISEGKTPEEALKIEHNCWMTIMPQIKMKSVDQEAPSIIKKLQQQGTMVLGLTARHPEEYSHSLEHVLSIGVDMRVGMPLGEGPHVLYGTTALYQDGIIFCGNHTKGTALKAFLKHADLNPKKIIFIDDKWANVKDVKKACKKLRIKYVGIRFNKADEKLAKLDPRIIEIQFLSLPTLISDEEAILLLKNLNQENVA